MVKQSDLTNRRDPNRYYPSGYSEPERNGNEGILYIPQSSRLEASSSDRFVSHPGHISFDQDGYERNGSEVVLHILKATPIDAV